MYRVQKQKCAKIECAVFWRKNAQNSWPSIALVEVTKEERIYSNSSSGDVVITPVEIERIRYPNRNRTVFGNVQQLEAHFC